MISRTWSLTTRPAIIVLVALLLATVAGLSVTSPELLRVTLAVGLGAAVVLTAFIAPATTAFCLLMGLVGLGLLRRLVLGASAGGALDPLLLIAPVGVALLVLVAARHGAFLFVSPLERCVGLFAMALLLGAFNPLQGGLAVGLGGLFFLLIPVLWFFIATALLTHQRVRYLFCAVVAASIASAVYGLYQTYVGFPSFDAAYVAAKGYEALEVGGRTRAFGPFTAASEYGTYLGCGLALILAVVKPRHLYWAVPAILVLVWAITIESSRGILVLSALAALVILVVRRGLSPLIVLPLAILGLFGLSSLASHFVNTSASASQGVSGLLQHQVQGLADPFSQQSTLGNHNARLQGGVASAFTKPLGSGTGFVTDAAGKFGGQGTGTEADPSNAASALGLPGLLLYGAILFLGLRQAYDLARRDRDWIAVGSLGILVATLLQWLNGGQYAVAPLAWLALGLVNARRTGRMSYISKPSRWQLFAKDVEVFQLRASG